MFSVLPLAPWMGGTTRYEGRILVMLAGGGNTRGIARHGQLVLGGGYSPDVFLVWQANNRVYLGDSGYYS